MDEHPELARWYLRKVFEAEAHSRREQEDGAGAVFLSLLAVGVADVHVDILAAFSALDRTESAVDRFGEMLSEVDFSTAPNAEDFVPRFIADQCDDEPLPSPSCRWH
jgi:hypothetical protein